MTLREEWSGGEDYTTDPEHPEEEQAAGDADLDLFRNVDPGSKRAFAYRQRYQSWLNIGE
ncbi:MAG: hypothetical protein AB1815_12165 [Bacillota bacterium]